MESIPKDALGRRKRFRKPTPSGRYVRESPADLEGFFLPLQRHGILNSHYLYEFRKQRAGLVNKEESVRRLAYLFDEDTSDYNGPCVMRPKGQENYRGADWHAPYYTLTRFGIYAIPEHDRYIYAPSQAKGWFRHQTATGAITGSIDLAAFAAGVPFGTSEDILRHQDCPEQTRQLDKPLALNLREKTIYDVKTGAARRVFETIHPDALFRLTYPTNIKFFSLETDMASEDYDTIEDKMRRWIYALEHDVPKAQWGTPSMIVLWVTTSRYRMERMMEILSRLTDDVEPHFFKYEPAFGSSKVLRYMPHFFTEPWYRADGSTFDISY